MVLLVFLVILLFLLGWLLLSPLLISIDTRVPVVEVKWVSIASISLILLEGKWRLKIHVLFYNTLKDLSSLIRRKRLPGKKAVNKKSKKPKHPLKVLRAIIRVVKSFSVRNCNLTFDTGDYATNSTLYALYAYPIIASHVLINYQSNNFFTVQMKNTPLKMLKAYLNIHFS
jgi:hypothetical protein